MGLLVGNLVALDTVLSFPPPLTAFTFSMPRPRSSLTPAERRERRQARYQRDREPVLAAASQRYRSLHPLELSSSSSDEGAPGALDLMRGGPIVPVPDSDPIEWTPADDPMEVTDEEDQLPASQASPEYLAPTEVDDVSSETSLEDGAVPVPDQIDEGSGEMSAVSPTLSFHGPAGELEEGMQAVSPTLSFHGPAGEPEEAEAEFSFTPAEDDDYMGASPLPWVELPPVIDDTFRYWRYAFVTPSALTEKVFDYYRAEAFLADQGHTLNNSDVVRYQIISPIVYFK